MTEYSFVLVLERVIIHPRQVVYNQLIISRLRPGCQKWREMSVG